MSMRFLLLPALALLSACATVPTPAERAERWLSDVSVLAADDMEGREAGTAGYQRAADYVAGRLEGLGLEPAGTEGYFQPVAFEEQRVLAAQSSASLVSTGKAIPLRVPQDMIISSRSGPRPAKVDAPLVFVGYGLHIPESGHDDFAGVDLKGKIAVFVSGGPANISGALKSHARSQRERLLAERGAVGMLALTTPKAVEVPWDRNVANSASAGLYLSDLALRDVPGEFFSASFDPAGNEKLFAGSGRSFAEIAALADASQPVPGFPLGQSLRADVAAERRGVESVNLVGRLAGSDPALKDEYVVLTAHLDGLGIRAAGEGDRINNGALDNAAGVATLLDIAEGIKRGRARPRRSILFVFVTGEEKGLMGSRYFASRPSVPARSIVADLNFDMALPIFPLTGITALGAEESSLGGDAQAVAASMGLALVPDPFPDRNAFIRSDQYSFIREGIPSLAFKFGFAKDTPEAATEAAWRSTRYHSPADDLSQPVFREDAIRLNDFVAALTLRIANAPERPSWLEQSFFARFAKP